jgi:ABC-type antimicrobial peptide transport system permease subunit
MNLFGANTPIIEDYFTIPVLPAYDAVLEEVRSVSGAELITSQVSGTAYTECLGEGEGSLLCGLDATTYFSLFPGIIVEEGRFLEPGEYGAMINAERANQIEKVTGTRPSPGVPVTFTAGGTFGFKIRQVPLVGIFSYQSTGQMMEQIMLVDAQTVRTLSSIQVASGDVDVPDEALNLLQNDIDDIFDSVDDVSGSSGIATPGKGLSIEELSSQLAEKESSVPTQGGDWNFIIIRLKDGVSPSLVIDALNKRLFPYGVQAVGWRTAAGVSALLVLLIQALFNAGIVLVSIAGILTIVNLLLISVFRRTREIGTLRAIGASDGYIRTLILGENLVLSFIAGLFGIVGGGVLMYVINRMNIVIPNDLIASLLGGRILTMVFLPEVAFTAFIVAVLVGTFASLYPVQKAVKIEPIVAVRQG